MRSNISVLTYNILAPKYSGWHSLCPPALLAWDHRGAAIEEELRAYDCDIVCLQEVQLDIYEQQLLPSMQGQGYDGMFAARQPLDSRLPEGIALFWKSAAMSGGGGGGSSGISDGGGGSSDSDGGNGSGNNGGFDLVASEVLQLSESGCVPGIPQRPASAVPRLDAAGERLPSPREGAARSSSSRPTSKPGEAICMDTLRHGSRGPAGAVPSSPGRACDTTRQEGPAACRSMQSQQHTY
ncbi:MAG: hypothetical protein WDW38_003323 [Sanguina aurantia]